MDANATESGFISYPTNRVVGTLSAADDATAAVDELVQAGFARDTIDVLHGEDDLVRLDPTGEAHGPLERIQRTLVRTLGQAEEYRHLMRHVEDLRAGRFVIMVPAAREQRLVVADILNGHGASFVGFYGRWAWEGLPPSAADTAGGPGASRPEDVPRLFAEAWNARDADALAALFDPQAEFVNVAGLWWRDRAAIRAAHAYGLEHIFPGSTLSLDEVRVKRLAEVVAIVHAAMTLTGQSPVAGIARPGPRRTIASFVVHRSGDRWTCAAAHNTDVMPGMETNVLDEQGALRAANYRTGRAG